MNEIRHAKNTILIWSLHIHIWEQLPWNVKYSVNQPALLSVMSNSQIDWYLFLAEWIEYQTHWCYLYKEQNWLCYIDIHKIFPWTVYIVYHPATWLWQLCHWWFSCLCLVPSILMIAFASLRLIAWENKLKYTCNC